MGSGFGPHRSSGSHRARCHSYCSSVPREGVLEQRVNVAGRKRGKKRGREEENPPELLSRAVPHTLLCPSRSASRAGLCRTGLWGVGGCAVPRGEGGPKNVQFLPESMSVLVA